MTQTFTVELFHGLCEGDAVHRLAALREPTGHDEAMLAEMNGTAPPVEQVSALIAALLVNVGGIERPGTEIAPRLTVGDRERLLLAVAARLLSPKIDLVAACPSCCALAEIPVGFADVIAARPDAPATYECAVEHQASDGVWLARCRPPTGADLENAARRGGDAGRGLIVDCVTILRDPGGRDAPPSDLPHECESTVADALAAFDPAAECRLTIECPSCAGTIEAMLDGFTILRTGLARSPGLYDDIYRMARAYHWSEAEIIALPPRRRRHYLAVAAGMEQRQ